MNTPSSIMGTSNNKKKFKVFVDDFVIPISCAIIVGFIAYKVSKNF